jgi:hypothetical protein
VRCLTFNETQIVDYFQATDLFPSLVPVEKSFPTGFPHAPKSSLTPGYAATAGTSLPAVDDATKGCTGEGTSGQAPQEQKGLVGIEEGGPPASSTPQPLTEMGSFSEGASDAISSLQGSQPLASLAATGEAAPKMAGASAPTPAKIASLSPERCPALAEEASSKLHDSSPSRPGEGCKPEQRSAAAVQLGSIGVQGTCEAPAATEGDSEEPCGSSREQGVAGVQVPCSSVADDLEGAFRTCTEQQSLAPAALEGQAEQQSTGHPSEIAAEDVAKEFGESATKATSIPAEEHTRRGVFTKDDGGRTGEAGDSTKVALSHLTESGGLAPASALHDGHTSGAAASIHPTVGSEESPHASKCMGEASAQPSSQERPESEAKPEPLGEDNTVLLAPAADIPTVGILTPVLGEGAVEDADGVRAEGEKAGTSSSDSFGMEEILTMAATQGKPLSIIALPFFLTFKFKIEAGVSETIEKATKAERTALRKNYDTGIGSLP